MREIIGFLGINLLLSFNYFISTLHFVSFWEGNIDLPKKRKVDALILTYARKKLRNVDSGGASMQPGASMLALVASPSVVSDYFVGDGDDLTLVSSGARDLEEAAL